MGYQDEYFRKKKLLESGVKDESGAIPPSAYSKQAMDERILNREKELASSKAPAAPAASSNGASVPDASAKAAAASGEAGTGSNTAGQIGSGLIAAGSVPTAASPYLLAAGVTMNMVGSAEQNKRKEQEAQRQSYNERIAERQKIMQQIASQGIA